MSATRLLVRLTAEEIQALIVQMPACCQCHRRAEVEIGGRLYCCQHGASQRNSKVETPVWTNAADVLAEALLSR